MQSSDIVLVPETNHHASIRILPRKRPSLSKPEPARDTTLGLRGLPLHCLIESINCLIELLFRIILALVELRSGIILELFEFGLGLAHFGGDGLVGVVNLLADIIHLYAVSLSAGTTRQSEKQAGKQAYGAIDLGARDLCPFFALLLRFPVGDVLAFQ